MTASLNKRNLAFGAPGLLLQFVGFYLGKIKGNETVGLPLQLIGGILLTVGLVYYAKAKNRHPALGLLGFLGIIGIIILALLKDLSEER